MFWTTYAQIVPNYPLMWGHIGVQYVCPTEAYTDWPKAQVLHKYLYCNISPSSALDEGKPAHLVVVGPSEFGSMLTPHLLRLP